MSFDLQRSDRFALGIFVTYFLFCVAYLWVEYRSASAPTSSSTETNRVGHSPHDEQVLDRLERGETVRVPRWHGHELELSAALVVDADALDQEDADGE